LATRQSKDSVEKEGGAGYALPAAFVAMHTGWGVGFWEQLLANKLKNKNS
jgi:hypothetical protein